MTGELHLSFVSFPKNSYIVVEGERCADRFFIIHQGRVALSKEVEIVAEERGNTLGPGDFFGVVATMSGHSHIETAKALTNVTLISVWRQQFSQLIQNNAQVVMKIIRQFSKRMRYLDEALTRLTLKSSAKIDSAHLFEVAEYYAGQGLSSQAHYAYQQYLKYSPNGENAARAREKMAKLASFAKTSVTNGKERVYSKDTMIFAEGEPGEELYIIKKGAVKIVKVAHNNEVLLAVLKAGDIFGEMAVLEAEPRAASAVAYGECHLEAIDGAAFEKMITAQPQIIARITSLLADRIWFIYKQLANTLLVDPLARIYDALLIQLEKKRVDVSSSRSFTFDFGLEELFNMVGLSPADGDRVMKPLLESTYFQMLHGRIYVREVSEVNQQAAYYRKMQQLEESRKRYAASKNRDRMAVIPKTR
jgi:CRP-like cAMP-binding protein